MMGEGIMAIFRSGLPNILVSTSLYSSIYISATHHVGNPSALLLYKVQPEI